MVGAGGGAALVDSAGSAGGASEVVDPLSQAGLVWMVASASAGAGVCQTRSPPNLQAEL